MRHISSQRGSTILQALLMMAVVAGMAVMGTRMLKTQQNSQKAAEVRGDLESLHSLVQATLQDKNNCTANFVFSNFKPSIPEVEVTRIISDGPGGAAEPIIEKGKSYFLNSIMVSGIKIGYDGSIPKSLLVTYDIDKDTQKSKTITKSIPIRFRMNGIFGFNECYMDEEDYNSSMIKEFCESLGKNNFFKWDDTNKACMIVPRNCRTQPGTLFQGFHANGEPICTKFTDVIPLTELFDTTTRDCTLSDTTSNLIRLEVTAQPNQKVKVSCVTGSSTGGGTTGGTPRTCSNCTGQCQDDMGTFCRQWGRSNGQCVRSRYTDTPCGGGGTTGSPPPAGTAKCVHTGSSGAPATGSSCQGNFLSNHSFNIYDANNNLEKTCSIESCSSGTGTNTCPSSPACQVPLDIDPGACRHGGWGATRWDPWSTCTGGNKTKSGTRLCNRPAPNSCGNPCSGSASVSETVTCTTSTAPNCDCYRSTRYCFVTLSGPGKCRVARISGNTCNRSDLEEVNDCR